MAKRNHGKLKKAAASKAPVLEPALRNPANEVFNIPELLELILLDVFWYDLFILQRVSRSFRNTIEGSPKLRHKISDTPFGPSRASDESSISTYMAVVFMERLQFGPFFMMWHSSDMTFAWGEGHEWRGDKYRGDDMYHGKLGWKGKSAVYSEGSWRGIALGAVEEEVTITVLSTTEEIRTIPAGGTLGDLFEVLEEMWDMLIWTNNVQRRRVNPK